MEEQEKTMLEKLKEETESIINGILEQGVEKENLELLGEVVDIHKDIANEEYWQKKEEIMRYRNYGRENYGEYGNYGRDNYGRENYGRNYSEGSYSARGYDAKYRGHGMIEDMSYNYGNYSEGKEQYGRLYCFNRCLHS